MSDLSRLTLDFARRNDDAFRHGARGRPHAPDADMARSRFCLRSVRTRGSHGAEVTFERTYPTGGQFAHAVGYSYIDLGRTGLESFRNRDLNGERESGLRTILDELQGSRRRGDEVVTTLNPGAQQTAIFHHDSMR